MLSSPFRIVFVSVFSSVFAGFCQLSTFCTCQLRLAFVFQLWGRGGWGRGGGGGDDVHANAACVFRFFFASYVRRISHRFFYGVFAYYRVFAHASLDLHLSFSSVRGWGGMGVMTTSMRMRLVSSVSLLRYFSNAAGCSVKPLLPLLVASLLKRQPCKKLELLKLSKQNFAANPQNHQK